MGLAVTAFPQQILPNKLLQEVRALAEAAGRKLPVVDEVAADIFMGDFSEKFLRAAQTAAALLRGSLYERYYGLPYDRVRAIDDVKKSRYGAASSPAFVRLCTELAGAGGSSRGSVAHNGTVIEQEQILTTHNLAVLVAALDLRPVLAPRAAELARRCLDFGLTELATAPPYRQGRLRAIKQCAYAFRQLVFFLSLGDAAAVEELLGYAWDRLIAQPEPLRSRFRPALAGLSRAARGMSPEEPPGVRRLQGWNDAGHWLLG